MFQGALQPPRGRLCVRLFENTYLQRSISRALPYRLTL
jgi:hypothetical protein